MSITFNCPNGHQLSAPDHRAGTSGKCPKCGAGFQVPAVQLDLEELGLSPLDDEIASPSRNPLSVPASSGGLPPENFVFLCPNGHRLNGPKTLIGKPGKCPHCGAKFVIPSADDVEEEQDLAALGAGDEIVMNVRGGSSIGSDSGPLDIPSSAKRNAPLDTGERDAREFDAARRMAELFASFWTYHMEQGATIEIHLKSGEMLVPDGYARELSFGSHGVFVVHDGDTYALTAAAWNAISHVTVRGVNFLPEGIFEGLDR